MVKPKGVAIMIGIGHLKKGKEMMNNGNEEEGKSTMHDEMHSENEIEVPVSQVEGKKVGEEVQANITGTISDIKNDVATISISDITFTSSKPQREKPKTIDEAFAEAQEQVKTK